MKQPIVQSAAASIERSDTITMVDTPGAAHTTPTKPFASSNATFIIGDTHVRKNSEIRVRLGTGMNRNRGNPGFSGSLQRTSHPFHIGNGNDETIGPRRDGGI